MSKGNVRCESCVCYIAAMSGLNCFLIVCFHATIFFPGWYSSPRVCNVSELMQLALYFCPMRRAVE